MSPPRWGSEPPVIWLAGLMATGKTTAGRLLAAQLGRPFLDTDSLVAERAGLTVAEVFAREGEAAFRRRESLAVQAAAARRGAVVALGGGAFVGAENRQVIRRSGAVICLTARPATVIDRLGPDEVAARPLLAGGDPAAALAALQAARAAVYAEADAQVATDGLTPDAVAARLAQLLEERQWLS